MRPICAPFPWTMLAGCGNVCIRKTAHKSTGVLISFPSEGSRQSTSKSLHKMPTNARGVNSGAKQSTCTVEESPCASNASKETMALRTTRVSLNDPSMISRLCGCTRGLGNRPRILACHWTSFLRDSDSRLPSFMLLASREISARALSRTSSP